MAWAGKVTYRSPDFQKGKLRPKRGSLSQSHIVTTSWNQDLNPLLLASWAQWLLPVSSPRYYLSGPQTWP